MDEDKTYNSYDDYLNSLTDEELKQEFEELEADYWIDECKNG